MVDLRDSDTKCPYCGKYLKLATQVECDGKLVDILCCSNFKCHLPLRAMASKEFIVALQQALDNFKEEQTERKKKSRMNQILISRCDAYGRLLERINFDLDAVRNHLKDFE